MGAPKRPWGWHELDPRWARILVRDARIEPGAWVVDVGAGTGALTGPLLDAGARVIAVEAHPGRADLLRRRFGREVIVVQADAADLRLPRRPYCVVANPPFALTSPLLRRLLQPGSRLVRARIVLQREAAERWAGPAAPGRGRWGRRFFVAAGRAVPAAAFRPRPDVAAQILCVDRLDGLSDLRGQQPRPGRAAPAQAGRSPRSRAR
ncbi:MAG TPA: rRNA adenine N-6-methyltransferase family protein [Acidimicrobiales bacterium]|nr:rRNA adenine N-6-methyltransferase family protein [Acidimicrobiales bacterium]